MRTIKHNLDFTFLSMRAVKEGDKRRTIKKG